MHPGRASSRGLKARRPPTPTLIKWLFFVNLYPELFA